MARALWITLLVLCTAGLATAQSDGPRFGYVDFQVALNGVNDGKRMKKSLEKDYAAKQKTLKKMENDLAKQQKALEKDQMLLSAEALQRKQNAYREAFYDFSQKMNTYQAEMAQAEATATADILSKLRGVVEKIGARDGYTMILESSQDVVLYAPSGSDVTKEVISAYNKKHR